MCLKIRGPSKVASEHSVSIRSGGRRSVLIFRRLTCAFLPFAARSGRFAGDAVAQVYIHQRYGSASRPVRQLKGFERISFKPGETRTLTFPLGREELKYWNPQTRESIVEPSEFDVWAGEDSTASLHADLTVTQ